MKLFHTLDILFLQLFLLLECRAAERRANDIFFIIKNTTFVCEDGEFQFNHFRKIELTDEDKKALLESEGGNFLSSYMALNRRSAEENFINLLLPLSNTKEKTKNSSPFHPMKRKSAMLNYLHEVIKKERQTSADEKMEDSNNGDSQESQKHPRGRFSRRGHLDQLAVPSTSNRHHSNPSAGRTVPYVLPHEIGLKNTYLSESGTATTLEFCFYRGTPTGDGQYLHMCTTCAATTNLTEDHIPAVLNEAKCHPEDLSCLYINEYPEGKCQQRQVWVKVLRKHEGYCSLALKNDETIIVDEWILEDHPINAGCECSMHKDSIVAPFL